MRRSTSNVDRLVTAAIAIVLLGAGIFTIAWRLDVALANKAIAHASPRWYALAPQQNWWDWTIGAIAIGAFVLGMWLLLANLRRNRLNAVELDGTGANGTLTVNVGQVGKAIAVMLERHPTVQSALSKTVVDGGQSILQITVVTEPPVSLAHLRRFVVETETDLHTALGDIDVALQFFVHYPPATVGRQTRRPAGRRST
ncbi:MAG: hypothetical protein WA988_15220 [Candidatus Nanopelagicales bacterium]